MSDDSGVTDDSEIIAINRKKILNKTHTFIFFLAIN